MTHHPIVPCLWLDHEADVAARFYVGLFPHGRIIHTTRYPTSFDTPAHKPPGSVLTVDFEVAGLRFTALNGGPEFKINPSVSFFVELPSLEDVEGTWRALAEGGQVLMPLGRYPWSERYGFVQDRFGVSWQVMQVATAGAPPATIIPCLMFAGRQRGRAAEALELYTRVFPGSSTLRLERYGPHEQPPGGIKHGRCLLGGQPLIVTDSHVDHPMAFDEALSLQVMCADQREVDHFWSALSEGGEPGPCGWLKDRFGLSWQISPRATSSWLTSSDEAARDRAFRAILDSTKPDIAAFQRAFDGA